MTPSADELKGQLPAVLLKAMGEVPAVGPLFKVLEVLSGIDESVLQKRWQASVEQKLKDLAADIQQLCSTSGVAQNSLKTVSDAQLHLIWQAQQLILDSSSREKRRAAARILFYSTLTECDLTCDLASRMMRDLVELENFHLLIIKTFGLQSDKSITVSQIPSSLAPFMSQTIFFKGLTDLVKLGFIVMADGTWAGSYKTDYLDMFQNYILQDIQS